MFYNIGPWFQTVTLIYLIPTILGWFQLFHEPWQSPVSTIERWAGASSFNQNSWRRNWQFADGKFEFCSNFVRILFEFCSNFVQILFEFYLNFGWILFEFWLNFFSILFNVCSIFVRILFKFWSNFVRILFEFLQICSNIVRILVSLNFIAHDQILFPWS